MKHTLLLRLAGPLQSWGSSSLGDTRETELEPTRSGVIGLIAGAMGMSRGEDLSKFDGLVMGVRVDQPGNVLRDYQTVYHGSVESYKTMSTKTSNKVTDRYYLADAVFVVGLESEDKEFLDTIELALSYPYYIPYLGRRSCTPTGKMCLGIYEGNVEENLRTVAWQAKEWYKAKGEVEECLTLVLEDVLGTYRRRDVPISFSSEARKYGFRYLRYLHGPKGVTVRRVFNEDYGIDNEYQNDVKVAHDPMSELN